jgi:hypothetical protein
MSVEITIVISALWFVVACLSAALAVMTFSRNSGKDSNIIESMLTRIETDVLYIRNSLEVTKDWRGYYGIVYI